VGGREEKVKKGERKKRWRGKKGVRKERSKKMCGKKVCE
jgi:hypothetical protein